MSTATKAAPDVQLIPALKIIQIPGMNPRGEFSHDDPEFLQLKASIEERGIESPIKVGPAEIKSGDELLYPAIWGHRRHAAALELGIDCPAIVDPTLDTPEKRYLAAISENQDRQDMSPVAEAAALVKLRDLGLKQEDAAKKMNVSVRTARDREKLLDMPEATRVAFDSGDIDLQAIPAISGIAKQAPKVAAALAQVAVGDPADASTHRLTPVPPVKPASKDQESATGKTRTDKAFALIKAEPGISAATIAQRLKVKPNYLYRILGDLEKAGRIKKDGRKYSAIEETKTV